MRFLSVGLCLAISSKNALWPEIIILLIYYCPVKAAIDSSIKIAWPFISLESDVAVFSCSFFS